MLRAEREGPVLRLTIDRPEVRNAFNDELIGRLAGAFAELDPAVRAVAIQSVGEAFCAGGDLQWMRKAARYTEDENARDALALARLYQAIVECPAVVVARVQGAAFGGGCGLVCAADVAVASTQAKFAFSEVRLGLIPATISPFVVAKIGHGNARAWFSTGEAFAAEAALRMGLVHEIAEPEALDQALERKIRAVLASGPRAVAQSKRIAVSPPSLDESARLLASARAREEAREGVGAFLEKRKASFVVER